MIGTVIHSGSANNLLYDQVEVATALGDPPVAIIGSPANNTSIDPGFPLRFDATASYDPDGGPITYLWEADPLPDRWGFPLGSSETRVAFNTRLQSPGNFTITLTVMDDETLTDSTMIFLHIRGDPNITTETTFTTTASIITSVETTDQTFMTGRPTYIPGFSVLPVLFTLITLVLVKRKVTR